MGREFDFQTRQVARRVLTSLTFWTCLIIPTIGLSQSFNGQIGGVVQDASKALIPGVTITLTGQETGVVTGTVTNESGAYNFPSVLPGVYRLRAELPGFRPSTLTDVQVGGATQLRLNFTLEVGALTESVEVSVTSQALLTESSATIGEVFRVNGGFELPFGPNKLFLGNSSKWLARLVERWQMNAILQLGTGSPTSITASNTFFANGRADIVGPANIKGGKVVWGSGVSGTYFGEGTFTTVPDPQCAATNRVDSMGFNLSDNCSLDAVADPSGNILLQQAKPGNRGTLGSQTVLLPGFRAFDANLQKTFRISETKSFSIRMDATNVLNSPDVDNPSLAITSNNNNFGQIGGKGMSHRQYRAQLRISF